MDLPHIFMSTHHKAGTVWMVSTFRRIAKANGYRFVHLNSGESGWDAREDKQEFFECELSGIETEGERPGVFVEFHSGMPDLSKAINGRGARGIHMIRDPRDMILSAIRFHLDSEEAWLHEPSDQLNGKTFQEHLRSLTSMEDRIRFELDWPMGKTIRELASFDDQGVFRVVKYEDLIVDEQMVLWHDILNHFEMRGLALIRSMRAFWESSIFGEMKEAARSGTHKHIRVAKVEQWKEQLSEAGLAMIQDELGDEIVKLGYELG